MLLDEIKRPKLTPLPRQPRVDVDPALLTYEEFWKVVNPKPKSHPSSAYDWSLAQMNDSDSDRIENYPRVIKRMILRGIQFEFRFRANTERWNDHQTGEPKAKTYYYIGVFNEDQQKVASAQDEWGCMLVVIAREYRGFGLGPTLTKMAYEIEPGKNTGGMSYSGGKVLQKAHRECVREALVTGRYSTLVKSGQITPARVKEIIVSAKLEIKQKTPKDNLTSNDPRDWVLYAGGYGDFILYDKKLRDVIETEKNTPHDPWDRHVDMSMWQEKMIKGIIYAHQMNAHSSDAIVYHLYGANEKIKQFMIGCSLTFCKENDLTLWVDPQDQQSVGKFGVLGDESLRTGYKRLPVVKINETLPTDHMALVEQLYRKQFDQYDEFKNLMLELAFSMSND